MRDVNEAVYSSRGRRLSSTGAAAAPRGGRGRAAAPRGGRGAAAAPRGSTSSRGGRGAAIVPREGNVGSTSTGLDSSTPQPSCDEYHPSEEEGEEDEFLQQEAYTEVVKEIHGPSFDIMNSPPDATPVYKAGKGKKHGRFLMGASYISIPATHSEVRTTSSGSTDDVHPQRRLRPSTDMISQLAQFKAKLQEAIEARQRLEQMVLALISRLDSSTPGAPLPTLSSPGTAGSMADSTTPDGDAGDGTHVSTPNQDHVDESIVKRPLEDNANESTHK